MDAVAHNLRIVLVGTTHPGNIGAAARAMKTMGLSELYLVAPKHYPSAEATARASGADDLLFRARVCETLEEALAGCGLVCGTSARARRVPWPELEARDCARLAVEEALRCPVAIVFGREHSGLSNEELDRCQRTVRIPTAPGYSSLNLAAAVQVMCYELYLAGRQARAAHPRKDPGARPAGVEDLERFYAHLEQVLAESGFLDAAHPGRLMRRLRRLFGRARLEKAEVNILRGMLRALTRGAQASDSSPESD